MTEGYSAIYYLYNALLILLSPALAIHLIKRLLLGKSRQGWRQRWGAVDQLPKRPETRRIWMHAASVGEVMAAEPVLKAYALLHPSDEIVMSVITPGGYEIARKMKGKYLADVVYAPFDLPFAVKRFIKAIQPDMLVILETEIWPNMLHLVRSSGANICLINGRISDKSLPGYRQFKPFVSWALSQQDSIMVQTETDYTRFIELGASPERTKVVGNAKFDQIPEPLDETRRAELRKDLRIPPDTPVWVVGSTRIADEERLVLDAYVRLLKDLPELVLIHAPRHIERADEIAAAMRERGLEPILRTALEDSDKSPKQIILNSFGELANIYALGNVAYTGNSLLPPGGGQSPLQPLAQGTPTLFGPYMTNFRDIVAMMQSTKTGWEVRDSEDLYQEAHRIILDSDLKARIRLEGPALIQKNRGSSQIYARTLSDMLDKRHSPPN